jgi:hypothetical protein
MGQAVTWKAVEKMRNRGVRVIQCFETSFYTTDTVRLSTVKDVTAISEFL